MYVNDVSHCKGTKKMWFRRGFVSKKLFCTIHISITRIGFGHTIYVKV